MFKCDRDRILSLVQRAIPRVVRKITTITIKLISAVHLDIGDFICLVHLDRALEVFGPGLHLRHRILAESSHEQSNSCIAGHARKS